MKPHHDLEFKLTLMGYDKWGNVLSYRIEPASIVEVIDNKGDHYNMMFENIEEYKELLCQLEPSSKEEYDDLPEDIS